jgi:drug/metabolite transporter (DMT)-like permease
MKLGVQTIDPIALNTLRFTLTAFLFLPFAGRISLENFLKLIPVSLFFVSGNLIFAYLALTHITSNSFVMITQIAQPIMLLLAYIFFKERFGFLTSMGIAIAVVGLIIVFGAPDILSSPIGAILGCIAALSWSLGSLAMKRTGDIKPASFLAYAYLMASPIAITSSYFLESGQIERVLNADMAILSFVLAYQVLLMGAMTLVWSGLMARNPAQLVTPFLMLQPIFAVVGSYYILGENLNANILWGGFVVLIGIGIINVRKIQKLHKDRKASKLKNKNNAL